MILFATDVHLNFLRVRGAVRAFGEYLAEEYSEADDLLITGDISEAPTLVTHLTQLADGWGKRILFLTGNHDYYGSSVYLVHKELKALQHPLLVWLDAPGLEPLQFDGFGLVGQYAWYDGLYGEPLKSQVLLYDWSSVEELTQVFNEYEWVYEIGRGSRHPLLTTLRWLAAEAAKQAKIKLEAALQCNSKVVFATHVAPFEGASWHEGKISNAQWLPWFTCRAMGEILAETAAAHPDHQILVLCGHNHSAGVYQHSANLRVVTGGARYGVPDAAGTVSLQSFTNWQCESGV